MYRDKKQSDITEGNEKEASLYKVDKEVLSEETVDPTCKIIGPIT